MNKSLEIALTSEMPVLLLGSTGVGKSTFAEEIHKNGLRKNQPFICINMASFHEGTLEAELFGAEKGAYTGSVFSRKGQIELAQNGTVFLDEIGELSPTMQARLLEFLQTKKIRRLGSETPRELNVRVISATNKDLWHEVQSGRFRMDLYFRLRGIEYRMPALTEMPAEFDEIVHKMIAQEAKKANRTILNVSENVAIALEEYSWPGNYRELQNVIEYMVLSASSEALQLKDLPPWFVSEKPDPTSPAPAMTLDDIGPDNLAYDEACRAFHLSYLRRALEISSGNQAKAADLAKINKSTFFRKLNEFGIRTGGQGGVDAPKHMGASAA